eukprot:gb/GEZN01000934.1/.p1 GENE.gb/GEZN01000934.1/~~gb/GEZN01000934.1/.p1  ORF type:complete len:1047 (+),score=67.81 gb/GEZN01000934.1/:26-3142(+)
MLDALFVLIACVRLVVADLSCPSPWAFDGPTAYVWGTEPDKPDSSAASYIILDGLQNGVWFVGSVNGGVWRTSSLRGASTSWEPVTDNQPVNCQSIGGMAVMAGNPNVVAAGCGGTTSSMMSSDWNSYNNGDWGGIMISRDGGDSWAMTNFPPNYYVASIVLIYPSTIIAAANSHFYNRSAGGVFVSNDLGNNWTVSLESPTQDLVYDPQQQNVFVAMARNTQSSVQISRDQGKTWGDLSQGIDWQLCCEGTTPFWSQISYSNADPARPVLLLGALTTDNIYKDYNVTETGIFYLEFNGSVGADNTWKAVENVFKMDLDHMPKDKMSLLLDPEVPFLLYIMQNAEYEVEDEGHFIYRVNISSGTWTSMVGDNFTGNLTGNQYRKFHDDAQKMAWHYPTHSLIAGSDGGPYINPWPRFLNGSWESLSGSLANLEIYWANWDSRLHRWAGASQDAQTLISPPGSGVVKAIGCADYDGSWTAVDNINCPSRLFGTGPGGDSGWPYMFWDTNPIKRYGLQALDFFPQASFPWFSVPLGLNAQTGKELFIYTCDLSADGQFPSFTSGSLSYFTIPDISALEKLPDPDSYTQPPPRLVAKVGGSIQVIVAGGFLDGRVESELVLLLNHSHLIIISGAMSSVPLVEAKALPFIFGEQLGWPYFPAKVTDPLYGHLKVAPLSHGVTIYMGVSPADAKIVAVTGWPPEFNAGPEHEHIFLTTDMGDRWTEVTGDLHQRVASVAMARPSGLCLVEFVGIMGEDPKLHALLVGTVNGAYISWTDNPGKWTRVATFRELPRVLVYSISYEPYSDTLLAATLGRGVYRLANAKQALWKSRSQQLNNDCGAPPKAVAGGLASSARFFTVQQDCSVCYGASCPAGTYISRATCNNNMTAHGTESCTSCSWGTCTNGTYLSGVMCTGNTTTDTELCSACNISQCSPGYYISDPCDGSSTSKPYCIPCSWMNSTCGKRGKYGRQCPGDGFENTEVTDCALSGGAIAGIVIGSAIGLALLGFCAVHYQRNKHKTSISPIAGAPQLAQEMSSADFNT